MKRRLLTRRSFLAASAGLCAAGPLALGAPPTLARSRTHPCRSRIPNPYVESGKPIVAVVRGAAYPAMLARGMELLGGFARLGSGKPVILKPNFLRPNAYPLITDGESIVATVEALQREGFSDITVADWGTRSRQTTEAFEFWGLQEKAASGGFRTLDLGGTECRTVADERFSAMTSVGVFERAYDAPLIINLPVIKQHSYVNFTCCLKNCMGPIDADSRIRMHRRDRSGADTETRQYESQLAVAEIAAAVNPDLHIIDARKLLGDSHFDLRQATVYEANTLIISGDPVAADVAAADLLASLHPRFDPSMVSATFAHAVRLGLGTADKDAVVTKEAQV